jgi:hypothetical protein
MLRVAVACLVLWLPARGSTASFGPADAVVMVAGSAIEAHSAAQNGVAVRSARRVLRRHASDIDVDAAPARATSVISARRPSVLRATSLRTADRVVTPIYLLHCALLC